MTRALRGALVALVLSGCVGGGDEGGDGGALDAGAGDGGALDGAAVDMAADMAARDLSTADMASLDMASLDMASLDMVSLDMASDMALLDMASLDMAPDMASLDMASTDTGAPDMAPDSEPPGCAAGVTVSDGAGALPAAAAGLYAEAFDCALDEGGPWFGGVDFTHCFRGADGWRLWNTGCGWALGRRDGGDWARVASTYVGACEATPPQQRDARALTTGVLYDGFGRRIEGARLDACAAPRVCEPGVVVSGVEGAGVPVELAGRYDEADDCVVGEGGAWFGGVDPRRCFRKGDGSAWRIWNTGCGWEIGRLEGGEWRRYGMTYVGACAALPAAQREASALTTGVLYDPLGQRVPGLRVDHCPAAVDCAPGVEVAVSARGVPAALGGRYVEAFDCARAEGGSWFGGVDYTRCYRGEGGLIWNTGCGWVLGRVEGPRGAGEWTRYATTYSGACEAMPAWQRDGRGLESRPLFDGFGRPLDGLEWDVCAPPTVCPPEAVVSGAGGPAGMAGVYTEAFDCAFDEGGAWFGGDYTHCFRGAGGWLMWNTGCGWEIGRVEDGEWVRHARTYSGGCEALPSAQLDAQALTTGVLYDGFGRVIDGLRVDHCR